MHNITSNWCSDFLQFYDLNFGLVFFSFSNGYIGEGGGSKRKEKRANSLLQSGANDVLIVWAYCMRWHLLLMAFMYLMFM